MAKWARSKADVLINTYKKLAKIPALTNANFSQNGKIINSSWSVRNLEKGKTSKFIKPYYITGEIGTFIEAAPLDISTEQLSASTTSEKYRAVLREVENKDATLQYLEIWDKNGLINSIDLAALDIHGKVYTDGEFGTFEWNSDETKLLYIAEKKFKKPESLHKRPKITENRKDEEIEPWMGDQYRQDWGEQLVGKIQPVAVYYDIGTDEFLVLNGIPDDVSIAQLIWSPKGDYIVGVAYKTTPRKLGLIYCFNRLSTIFKLDLNGHYTEIKRVNKSVKSPKYTPDGNTLIWLEREAGGPHHGCLALMQTKEPITETTPKVVVDIVQTSKQITNNKLFYGLYCGSFPKRCWTNDGRLLLATNQQNTINTYIINLESEKLTELPYSNGSQIVLDVYNDNILANRRNFFNRDQLVAGKIPENGSESEIQWIPISEEYTIDPDMKLTYEYLNLKQDNDDEIKDFTAIYVGPKSGDKETVPLIIWPHGGPHSAHANNLALEISFVLSQNFGILFVNYRGSIGAGQSSADYLLGRVGKADVEDCVLATHKALEKFVWLDPEMVALIGGSHGGFLVTHLSGQYPDLYKVVVARNPVIDIASMSTASDIPDWCYVESGYDYTQNGAFNEKILQAMSKASPIQHAHKVKAPTLLQIGTKDLRVPPFQGVEYYHRLKANNIEVEMNLYEDNHPLGQVPNEMNNIISSAMWLDKHLV